MSRGRKPAELGWLVRIGDDVITGFRYPTPGAKKFAPGPGEVCLAQSCIARLGKGAPFQWGALHRDSADYVALQLGGTVERAIERADEPELQSQEADDSEAEPVAKQEEKSHEAQVSLFGYVP